MDRANAHGGLRGAFLAQRVGIIVSWTVAVALAARSILRPQAVVLEILLSVWIFAMAASAVVVWRPGREFHPPKRTLLAVAPMLPAIQAGVACRTAWRRVCSQQGVSEITDNSRQQTVANGI